MELDVPLTLFEPRVHFSLYKIWNYGKFIFYIVMFNLQISHFQKGYLSFFFLFSSYTLKNLDKCVTLDCPLKHKQNAHSCHVKFFRLHTSFNMVKDQPKPPSNCEGKITMRLFCQNPRLVELGFIENSLTCFILNPFIFVD
jgi:hypothetical protein